VTLTLVTTLIISTVSLFVGCAPSYAQVAKHPTEAASAKTSLPAVTAVAGLSAILGSAPTVKALMRDSINPAARSLWTAVSYVATAEGTQETMPTTDADWQRLQQQVDSLLKAGFALTLPNLTAEANASATPAYQYATADIAALVATMPTAWRNYSERMQAVSLQIADSIKRRDVQTFTELGATLNQACEGCHAEYWYRPLSE
jgi:hypothetical protein